MTFTGDDVFHVTGFETTHSRLARKQILSELTQVVADRSCKPDACYNNALVRELIHASGGIVIENLGSLFSAPETIDNLATRRNFKFIVGSKIAQVFKQINEKQQKFRAYPGF
jgi:hypothetical protein